MNENISDSLVNSIFSASSSEVLMDISEAILDSHMDDSLLKEIPIIGTIYNFSKTVSSISDKLFLKKILRFLMGLNDIPEADIRSFRNKLNDDANFKKKVGDKLLFIIDRCEDDEKAIIISKIFSAYITKKIDYDDFLKLAKAIESLSIVELNHFITAKYWDFSSDSKLISEGLLWQELIAGDPKEDNLQFVIHVSISTLGEELKEILLN